MLCVEKFNQICKEKNISVEDLAGHLVHGGFTRDDAARAIGNWQKKRFKPVPTVDHVERLAGALGVEVNEISQWRATYRYAPSSARKARLIAELISGRPVQDALDVLKFEHRRAASMIRKVLESAVANADEAAADVEHLYINEARVDGAGRRIGTKGWIAKDRGRAHPIRKEASHIHVSVTEE
ncbi:MAG: 50S ribosomal protein L22 [Sedimentisphaerales bacterium]|nr:50S ribosomal protein L22 [Sedimentisphaerales bacterium]